MKKIATFLTALILFFNSVSGQKPGDVELSVGSGVWSSDELFDGYSPGFLMGATLRDYINTQYSGTYHVTAKYFVNKRISVGITFAYENESGDWRKNDPTSDRNEFTIVQLGTFKRQAFTFAPEVYLTYLNKGIARLYCTAGLGFTYHHEVDRYSDSYYMAAGYYNGMSTLGTPQEFNNNKVQPNVYFSPLGMSIGGRVQWFTEIGIGYKGVINTGLSVKLL
jgi:hypothetical protein